MWVRAEPRVSSEEILALRGVSVAYANRPVLQDLHWEWHWGQSVLVVGPSGAGKSTLAMLAAGLIPWSVEAEVSGEVQRHPALDAPGTVGYVFQDPDSQFCQIRAGEEVAFGLENQKRDPSQMDAEVKKALRLSRLAVRLTQEHMTLSGGNKQKLAIASALALNPRLMILDEPTANLDPASTAQVFREIGELFERGITLMVIEHKFLEVAPKLPWLLLLDNAGGIHRFGPTNQLLKEERDWMRSAGLLNDEPSPRRPTLKDGKNVLTLTGVSARYHRRGPAVLSDVDLSVREGELLALVGANGAGKSTLLKVMAGLMKPFSGRVIRSDGGDAAFGFQNPEHQFIFEQVADELANRHVTGDVPPHVEQLLHQFRLSENARSSPYALSQGQKRRLSVAVMLEHAHPLYCLDEPTFGQDAATREMIMARLSDRQRQGAAVVISTHDLELVERWADRVVVVDGGRIAFDGTWDHLKEKSALLARARLQASSELEEPVESSPPVFTTGTPQSRSSLLGRLNPAWKLVSVFVAVGLSAFAQRLGQAVPLALIPIVLLTTFSGLSPLAVAKRLLPFVAFFALYTWTLTAYAAVGPHTPVIHILWYRLSYPGFLKGLVLGFRMLSAVSFGLLFVSTVDLVDLVKSLSKDFHVPPKFSYGTLAGLRFFPQFQEEWSKLRLARRVRGRDARWSMARIVTYALPLLSDAVRLSERVAIAMEARGFKAAPAESSAHRTYYHPSSTGWRDLVFGLVLVGASALALWH